MILPVILAGGSGSRLWPLSRDLMPKQYLRLSGTTTMLQETIIRLNNLETLPSIVICNEEQRFIAAEQLRQMNELDHNIILEPVGRNTAPAVALAAFVAMKQYDDPELLVLAADHVMKDTESFEACVTKAHKLVIEDRLVTFGIEPTHPETGYGYIQKGQCLSDAYFVKKFVEKPDLSAATDYISAGEYFWNSGMFMFKARKYLEELKKHRPDIYSACEKSVEQVDLDMDFIRVNKEEFIKCPEESIDYAVMEKTDNAVVVPLDAGWSDVGSWSSLWDISEKDSFGNVCSGDVINVESSNNFIFAETGLVATVGLKDVVVVQTKDAVLVATKGSVQDVKKVVQHLKAEGRTEHRVHREVYRPWGKYDSVDVAERYQVKRITVKPGEKLSIQMHHHRAEHWIVVSGTANVTINDKTSLVTENESVYIPVGAIHALENPGKIPLELIEVQSGPYLGEDDIVRFEDRYGRV